MSNIHSLIPKIMAEVGAIAKERQSGEGGGPRYTFRGIEDVYFALQPLFAKHGVFCAPRVISQEREERATKSGGVITYSVLRVEFRFYADDGSYIEATTVGEAMDSSDKSSNKAMSAAFKYVMFQVFCIPVEEEKDNDTENNNHELGAAREPLKASGNPSPVAVRVASNAGSEQRPTHPSQAQIKYMFTLMTKYKIPEELLRHYVKTEFGHESTKDMTLAQFDQIVNAMDRGLIV